MFVEHHTEANIFHHPLWTECLSQSYGYLPFAFVAKGGNSQILAGLPVMEINSWLTGNRWVALPFSDHCRPLLKNEKDIKSFTTELINKCKAINIPKLEIRHYLPSMEGLSHGESYFIHYLNLVDKPKNIFKRFRKKGVQYCIKKPVSFHKQGKIYKA